MKKKDVVLAAALLAVLGGGSSCDTQTGNSGEGDSEVSSEQNQLKAGLIKVLKSEGRAGGIAYVRQEVDNRYKSMNDALKQKDIPGFMREYETSVRLKRDLMDIPLDYSGTAFFSMFDDLTRGPFGNIASVVYSNPDILENWPQSCKGGNEEVSEMTRFLDRFNRNRRLASGSQDDPDNADGSAHLIHHNAATLKIGEQGLHVEAHEYAPHFFVDGDYTSMRFMARANMSLISAFTTSHDDESPLDATIQRCTVIDLGMNGIDTCDARLNRISPTDAAIKAANERARDCIRPVYKVVKQRYAGKGFFDF